MTTEEIKRACLEALAYQHDNTCINDAERVEADKEYFNLHIGIRQAIDQMDSVEVPQHGRYGELPDGTIVGPT